MMVFTPSQLATVLTTLTDKLLADIIIHKEGKSRRVKLKDLRAKIIADVTANFTYIDTTAQIQWGDDIDRVAILLENAADTDHTHDPGTIGLSNVANLQPEEYPVSLAVEEALLTKLDRDTAVEAVTSLKLAAPPQW
jgi:hypothetical protein